MKTITSFACYKNCTIYNIKKTLKIINLKFYHSNNNIRTCTFTKVHYTFYSTGTKFNNNVNTISLWQTSVNNFSTKLIILIICIILSYKLYIGSCRFHKHY